MAFFNEFPHSRTYDSDLGWLLARVKTLIDEIEALQDTTGDHTEEIADLKEKVQALFDALEEPVKPWDSTVYYRMYQTVEYNGMYYTAIKDVPAGIGIGDTNYWIASSGVMTVITVMQESLETLQEQYETLNDDLGAETQARTDADTAINNDLKWAQLADHDADYPLIKPFADYVPGKGAVYGVTIERNINANSNIINGFLQLYVANSNETAPQVAKANKWRAMIAGPLRNKYVKDGVMYGTQNVEAQYWFGYGAGTGSWGYVPTYQTPTDEYLANRFNKWGILVWSPIIYYENAFTPPAQVMNAILSNNETFSSYIWNRPHPRQVLALGQYPNGRNIFIMLAFNGRHYGDVGFTCPDMIEYLQTTTRFNVGWAINMDGGGNTQLYVGSNRLNPPTNPYNRNTFAYIYADAREAW